jgi:hypothetical protein
MIKRSTNRKAFNNPICKACIKKNFDKYGKFACDCTGITVEEDVKFAIKNGSTEHEARWMFDPVYFFETIYGSKVRHYQKRILYCTAKSLSGRQCRQTGKTLMFMFKIFHQVITNDNTSVLIVAPTEKQILETWNKYIYKAFIYKSEEIKESVVSSAKSPSYEVTFDNGSRITMSIANESCRGWTGSILYIDEAALVPAEMLNSIIMTIASAGCDAFYYYTSTPKGRGNTFYSVCKDSPETNEFHVPIYDVEDMASQIPKFKKLLGETGFIQECEAEFPDASGGPFNYKGIDLARGEYEYEGCVREPGYLYFGGVDWNGPNVGTYFYIVGFNPDTNHIKAVDKKIVSSAVWNSTVAKQTFIELNRLWQPKHWMVDYGYSNAIIEDLKLWSIKIEQEGLVPLGHPDAMVKHILEPVPFGAWLEVEDPFTKEETKKTTRGFIVAQVSKLFEPENGCVPLTYPRTDLDLIESLENYKTLNITSKGTEQYGFDKDFRLEDHLIDSFLLAIYGIVKHYSELFKRIIASSVMINARELFTPKDETGNVSIHYGQSIILLTDNSPELIQLDERKVKSFEPNEDNLIPIISRTFDRGIGKNHSKSIKRTNYVLSRDLPF